jgi:hypothetical protein
VNPRARIGRWQGHRTAGRRAARGDGGVLSAGREAFARLIVGSPPARPASVQAAHNEDYVADDVDGPRRGAGAEPVAAGRGPVRALAQQDRRRGRPSRSTPAVFGHDASWTIENDSRGLRGLDVRRGGRGGGLSHPLRRRFGHLRLQRRPARPVSRTVWRRCCARDIPGGASTSERRRAGMVVGAGAALLRSLRLACIPIS